MTPERLSEIELNCDLGWYVVGQPEELLKEVKRLQAVYDKLVPAFLAADDFHSYMFAVAQHHCQHCGKPPLGEKACSLANKYSSSACRARSALHKSGMSWDEIIPIEKSGE